MAPFEIKQEILVTEADWREKQDAAVAWIRRRMQDLGKPLEVEVPLTATMGIRNADGTLLMTIWIVVTKGKGKYGRLLD